MPTEMLKYSSLGAIPGALWGLLVHALLPGSWLILQLIVLILGTVSGGHLVSQLLLGHREDRPDPALVPVMAAGGIVVAVLSLFLFAGPLHALPEILVMAMQGGLYGGAMGCYAGEKVGSALRALREVFTSIKADEPWWTTGGAAYAVRQMNLDWNRPDPDDARQPTLLHYAAEQGLTDLTEALLEQGARPTRRDAAGELPVHYAARYGQAEVAGLLAAHTSLSLQDQVRALDLAKRYQHTEVVATLKQRGVRARIERGAESAVI